MPANLDLVLGNDITSPVAIKEMEKIQAKGVFDKDKIALVPEPMMCRITSLPLTHLAGLPVSTNRMAEGTLNHALPVSGFPYLYLRRSGGIFHGGGQYRYGGGNGYRQSMVPDNHLVNGNGLHLSDLVDGMGILGQVGKCHRGPQGAQVIPAGHGGRAPEDLCPGRLCGQHAHLRPLSGRLHGHSGGGGALCLHHQQELCRAQGRRVLRSMVYSSSYTASLSASYIL